MTCAEAHGGRAARGVRTLCRYGNGEQRYNAEPIVAAGGGLLVENATLTPEWIVREIVIPLMTDPAGWPAMSKSAARRRESATRTSSCARAVLNVAVEHR